MQHSQRTVQQLAAHSATNRDPFEFDLLKLGTIILPRNKSFSNIVFCFCGSVLSILVTVALVLLYAMEECAWVGAATLYLF